MLTPVLRLGALDPDLLDFQVAIAAADFANRPEQLKYTRLELGQSAEVRSTFNCFVRGAEMKFDQSSRYAIEGLRSECNVLGATNVFRYDVVRKGPRRGLP